ncbi:hypothetical protein Tco_0767957 [Tanacetum coccineum]
MSIKEVIKTIHRLKTRGIRGTTSSSSSSSSHNMAFVSSPSSTNEVNTAYGVSTANTQVNLATTQVSTASTQDLEQIHEDDIEETDLKWQLALLSMRTRRMVFQETRHFTRECRGPRNQDSRNRNQDSSRRTVNVEETSSKAMVAIDGAVNGPKTSKSVSEDISNEVRESPNAPLVKKLVSDDKLEKKTIFPTIAKIEFVRPKQQEKPVRKPVKYAKMYRLTTITIKGKGWYLGIIIQGVLYNLSAKRLTLMLIGTWFQEHFNENWPKIT